MFLEIKSLLQADELSRLAALAAEIPFVDGRQSNPANTSKSNLQADPADLRFAESSQIVGRALMRSPEFVEFSFPRHIAPPLLARYEPGMKYGAHADAAVITLPNGLALRSDLSCTVFINEPNSYDGGELVIHLGTVPVALKGPAGSAIVYPSTQLHEVRPVRSGTRLVSITFIESRIPDEEERTQLYELGEISAIEGARMNWANRVRLEVVRANLMRKWMR